MTKLAPLITGFLRDYKRRQRGYSPESCETYAFSFKLLFDFAAKRLGTRPSRLTIEDLDAPLIVAFLAHIEQERGNGAATRNLRLAAIKTFMRYVEHRVPSALEQIGRIHAIPVKRHDQKLIRHLTMEEVRAILNAPDLATRSGVRDRAMMHLCFAGGLRVSELVGVLIENLSLQHGASVTIRGKGRKERCLPLWKDTARDLRAWLSVRGAVRVPELFVNAQDEPMTRAGFEYVLGKHVVLRPRRARLCAVVQSLRTSFGIAARWSCCRRRTISGRWRCGLGMPTSAQPRSTSAWILRKSSRQWKRSFCRSCAAVGSGRRMH